MTILKRVGTELIKVIKHDSVCVLVMLMLFGFIMLRTGPRKVSKKKPNMPHYKKKSDTVNLLCSVWCFIATQIYGDKENVRPRVSLYIKLI
jgi:hypothetical protein